MTNFDLITQIRKINSICLSENVWMSFDFHFESSNIVIINCILIVGDVIWNSIFDGTVPIDHYQGSITDVVAGVKTRTLSLETVVS